MDLQNSNRPQLTQPTKQQKLAGEIVCGLLCNIVIFIVWYIFAFDNPDIEDDESNCYVAVNGTICEPGSNLTNSNSTNNSSSINMTAKYI